MHASRSRFKSIEGEETQLNELWMGKRLMTIMFEFGNEFLPKHSGKELEINCNFSN